MNFGMGLGEEISLAALFCTCKDPVVTDWARSGEGSRDRATKATWDRGAQEAFRVLDLNFFVKSGMKISKDRSRS